MTTFTLISYKPSSHWNDYYYESDMECFVTTSEEDLVNKWANFLYTNHFQDRDEYNYRFTLLCDGNDFEDGDDWEAKRELFNNLECHARVIAEALIEKEQAKRDKKETERICRQADIEKENRRTEYLKLKKEFGNDDTNNT